jgi:SOS response associated peptidase (SRAP)
VAPCRTLGACPRRWVGVSGARDTDVNGKLRVTQVRRGGICLVSNVNGYAVWLNPTARDIEPLQALLTPYPADAMTAYPVSTRVNNPANDAPERITPLV